VLVAPCGGGERAAAAMCGTQMGPVGTKTLFRVQVV